MKNISNELWSQVRDRVWFRVWSQVRDRVWSRVGPKNL